MRAVPVGVFAILALWLAGWWALARSAAAERDEGLAAVVDRLRQADARLQRDLLRARGTVGASYDPVNHDLARLVELAGEVGRREPRVAEALQDAVAERTQLVDDFRRADSVLKNAGQTIASLVLAGDDDPRVHRALVALGGRAMAYRVSDGDPAAVRAELASVRGGPVRSPSLDLLARHVEVMLRHQPDANALLATMERSPIAAPALRVDALLEAREREAAARAFLANAMLGGTGVALGFVVIGFVVHQRRSGDALRAAVARLDAQNAELAAASLARERAVEALILARDQADVANRTKSTFLANMSHEMRTPLNAIIGYAELVDEELEMLGQPNATDELREDLGRVQGAARHLLRLISHVLDLSKIEAGHGHVELDTFRVADVLEEARHAALPAMSRNGDVLSVDDQLPGDALLTSDRAKVLEMLGNLLDNAAKFTSRGSVVLSACAEVRDGRPVTVFRVSDTGIGIPEAGLARVFDAFTQVDPSATRRFDGTGLGLALVRHHAQMLGGSVSASSAEGGGSTFTLVLRDLAEADLPARPSLQARPADGSIAPIPRPEPSGRRGPVLVVEDDDAARRLLRRALEREGWEVEDVGSGRSALERLGERLPAVVLLDLMMPEVDGFAVIDAMQRDPVLRAVPVVVCTAMELDAAARERLRGALDVLPKRDLHDPAHIVAGVRPYLEPVPAGPTLH